MRHSTTIRIAQASPGRERIEDLPPLNRIGGSRLGSATKDRVPADDAWTILLIVGLSVAVSVELGLRGAEEKKEAERPSQEGQANGSRGSDREGRTSEAIMEPPYQTA